MLCLGLTASGVPRSWAAEPDCVLRLPDAAHVPPGVCPRFTWCCAPPDARVKHPASALTCRASQRMYCVRRGRRTCAVRGADKSRQCRPLEVRLLPAAFKTRFQGPASVQSFASQAESTPCLCAGGEMAQLVCTNQNCRVVLMYPRGASQVQCSVCHTINCAAAVSPPTTPTLCSHSCSPARLHSTLCSDGVAAN